MRSVFDEEEEVEKERTPRGKYAPRNEDDEDAYADHDANNGDDREVTLSSTTLLLIFFGLVLICALFFGLGYTLGRRSTPATSSPLPGSAAASSAFPSSGALKPSAAAQPSTAQPEAISETPAPEPTEDSTGDSAQPEAAAPNPAPRPAPKPAITPAPEAAAPAPRQVRAALPTTASPAPEAATPAATGTPTGTPTGTMVQIAAISNPADADVLVRALQKHGYTVTVRHATTDTLLHVQVGPFANRPDAIAMRQKLLSDGYNAILK
jgi:cell division septation protein DedD